MPAKYDCLQQCVKARLPLEYIYPPRRERKESQKNMFYNVPGEITGNQRRINHFFFSLKVGGGRWRVRARGRGILEATRGERSKWGGYVIGS